jgi:phosphatidylglycerophosphate synthase
MTIALLVGPDAGIGAQLRELGVDAVEIIAPQAIAERARAGEGDLVLAYGDIVTNREALAGLLEDPRIANGVLADGERVLGVLKIRAEQRALLAQSAERVAGEDDPLAALAADLAGNGLPLRTVDQERIRLNSAVKSVDGFFTTFFVSPYSRYVARWAARRGLTPNQVTVASLAIGLLCAAAFATGERWGLIAGAVLLQIAFTADCVDGQLARYTRNFSQLGGWLDATFDRAKEWLVYAGLAIGSGHVWVLAGAALTLQTVRHMVDFCWQETRRAGAETGDELGRWGEMDRITIVPWIKRIVAFPIGERFAAISITAAIWSPRTTFVVLLAWGGFAALYGTTGRILRSLRLQGEARADVARYRDDGPLASRLHMGGWLLPPLLRAVEYGALITFGALAGDSSKPAAFALIAALALRHYDIVYAPRFRGAPPRVAMGGWEGRIALAAVLLAIGALPAAFYVLAAIIAMVTITAAIRDWTMKRRLA